MPAKLKKNKPKYLYIKGSELGTYKDNDKIVKVISGKYENAEGPEKNHNVEPIYFHIVLNEGKEFSCDAPEGHNSFIYLLKGELKIGDKLVTENGLIEVKNIKSKEINNPEMPLYNFNVSNDNSYIADGYVVHNKGGDGGQQNNGPDASGTEGEDQGRFAADGGLMYANGGRVNFKYGGIANIL